VPSFLDVLYIIQIFTGLLNEVSLNWVAVSIHRLEFFVARQSHLALKGLLLGPFLLLVEVFCCLLLLPGEEVLPHVLLDLSKCSVLDRECRLGQVLSR